MMLPHFPSQYNNENMKGGIVDNLAILFKRVLYVLQGTTVTIVFTVNISK